MWEEFHEAFKVKEWRRNSVATDGNIESDFDSCKLLKLCKNPPISHVCAHSCTMEYLFRFLVWVRRGWRRTWWIHSHLSFVDCSSEQYSLSEEAVQFRKWSNCFKLLNNHLVTSVVNSYFYPQGVVLVMKRPDPGQTHT